MAAWRLAAVEPTDSWLRRLAAMARMECLGDHAMAPVLSGYGQLQIVPSDHTGCFRPVRNARGDEARALPQFDDCFFFGCTSFLRCPA